jgi:hypothetical protein
MRQTRWLSESEQGLMSEAAVSLALAACNKKLIQGFGLAFKQSKVPLDQLDSYSLPEPMLSVNSIEVLRCNGHSISCLFPRAHSTSERRLTLAFETKLKYEFMWFFDGGFVG